MKETMTLDATIDETKISRDVAVNKITTKTMTTELLGKRKEAPMSPPALESSVSPTNPLVDAAFKRLFGYSWGTTFHLSKVNSKVTQPHSVENQMVQIFGPTRTARIMNLPWDVVAPLSCNPKKSLGDCYNPAAELTTKISVATQSLVHTHASPSCTEAATSASRIQSSKTANKKRRLEETDYMSIALPAHMVSSSSINSVLDSDDVQVTTNQTTNHKTSTAHTTASNIDNVLSQIAGKKKLNTVEKSSNDWEGFKETDKTLQDELERQAQGKNAYLVKQDFLNRVDQRTFEIEKEERDRERSRRAAESK
mmetsp:Transcript_31010/g.73072  ORF Transcript_31010/g.73072 Transcript_31010/m.73072 type:complete len:310 (-) Transcript_31010:1152-2081(-)